MKKVTSIIVMCVFAMALVGFAVAEDDTQLVEAPAIQETTPKSDDQGTCVSKEQVSELAKMSQEDLNDWAFDNGLMATPTGGGAQGCPPAEKCSDGVNCSVTSTCYGWFDSGEQVCGSFECKDNQTVRYMRCVCTGETCPVFQGSRLRCE